jgi:hypothetical protein
MARLGRRLLHIGLTGMGAGLAVLYAVLAHAGTGIGSTGFIAPLFVFGIGMGTIFSPMFGVILGEVTDAEVGSASSVLQAVQQLGLSLGVAVIGTAYFGLAVNRRDSTGAAQAACLIALGLIALAFAAGFLLPAGARTEPAR